MSNDLQSQLQDPHAHANITTARSLKDAANSEQSLEGYAAINGLGDQDEIARLAYQFFEDRQQLGREGTAHDDWLRAEAEMRHRRSSLGR